MIDLIFGWLYAWGVMVLWDRIDARRAAKVGTSDRHELEVRA